MLSRWAKKKSIQVIREKLIRSKFNLIKVFVLAPECRTLPLSLLHNSFCLVGEASLFHVAQPSGVLLGYSLSSVFRLFFFRRRFLGADFSSTAFEAALPPRL